MAENRDTFLKTLSELRELASKGSDADVKKFNAIAKSLLWDLESSFMLPLPVEQMEFIKVLATSEAGGDYWKGYGEALTTFLLPLHRSKYQESPAPEPKAAKSSDSLPLEIKQPPAKKSATPDPQHEFIMD